MLLAEPMAFEQEVRQYRSLRPQHPKVAAGRHQFLRSFAGGSHWCPALLVPHSQQSTGSPGLLDELFFDWCRLAFAGDVAPDVHRVLLATVVFEDGLFCFAFSSYLVPV